MGCHLLKAEWPFLRVWPVRLQALVPLVEFVASIASKLGIYPLTARNGVVGHFVVAFKAAAAAAAAVAAAKIALNAVNPDIGPQTVLTRALRRQGEAAAAADQRPPPLGVVAAPESVAANVALAMKEKKLRPNEVARKSSSNKLLFICF
jgi:hypothetical protein